MNPIFNGKAKYSTKNLKGEYTDDNFWLVNEKDRFLKSSS